MRIMLQNSITGSNVLLQYKYYISPSFCFVSYPHEMQSKRIFYILYNIYLSLYIIFIICILYLVKDILDFNFLITYFIFIYFIIYIIEYILDFISLYYNYLLIIIYLQYIALYIFNRIFYIYTLYNIFYILYKYILYS